MRADARAGRGRRGGTETVVQTQFCRMQELWVTHVT
jgi:hypothetical protein